MSGGRFDYEQDKIVDIGRQVERLINTNGKSAFDKTWEGYSPETIAEFKKAVIALNKAFIYANRIDWFVCGDDGEETFHDRLKNELATVEDE